MEAVQDRVGELSSAVEGRLEAPPVPQLSSHSEQRRDRFSVNLLFNVGHLGFMMVVGVWYVPFMVKHLGPAAYGLVPLATSIISYMSLITLALNSAVGRSITIALEQNGTRRANLIFNTSLWAGLGLMVLLIGPALLAISFLEHIVHIPSGYEYQTKVLFAGILGAFLLNELKTPFDVSSFCRNRFDLRNGVAIAETLTRVGLVVILFWAVAPKLEYVGFAVFCGTIVSFGGAVYLWRKLTPTLHLQPRKFDWAILRGLSATGGWVVVTQLGVILYLNIDLLLANRFAEAHAAGQYAAVLQIPFLLRSLAIAVGGVFAPTMMHIYARGQTDELVEYLQRSIRFLGLVLAIPIGLICGFAEPILRLWLGAGFGSLWPLLVIMTAHLCINLSMYPLYTLPLAADRVKVPGLFTLVIGCANIALAIFLAAGLGWGLYGIAISGAILLTVRHLFFTPWYAARILCRPTGTFFNQVVPIVLTTAGTAAAGRLYLTQWQIANWIDFVVAASVITVCLVACIFVFVLSARERVELRTAILRLPYMLSGVSS